MSDYLSNLINNFRVWEVFLLAAREGAISGVSVERKFGRNAAATTLTDIISQGGEYAEPASEAIVNVASTSANDTAAGTGARTVRIIGVDWSWARATEDVTLNGLSNVATTTKFRGINRAYVLTAGSGNKQAGDITMTSAAAGTPVLSAIKYFSTFAPNQTNSSIFHVPAGETGYIMDMEASIQSTNVNGTIDIALLIKELGGVFRSTEDLHFSQSGTTSDYVEFHSFIRCPEKTIIKMQCTQASHAADANAGYEMILITN